MFLAPPHVGRGCGRSKNAPTEFDEILNIVCRLIIGRGCGRVVLSPTGLDLYYGRVVEGADPYRV